MENELVVELLEVLNKHMALPPVLLRNEKIKLQYKKLRAEGMKSLDAREKLAEEFFIDVKSIEKVIYARKKKNENECKSSCK